MHFLTIFLSLIIDTWEDQELIRKLNTSHFTCIQELIFFPIWPQGPMLGRGNDLQMVEWCPGRGRCVCLCVFFLICRLWTWMICPSCFRVFDTLLSVDFSLLPNLYASNDACKRAFLVSFCIKFGKLYKTMISCRKQFFIPSGSIWGYQVESKAQNNPRSMLIHFSTSKYSFDFSFKDW